MLARRLIRAVFPPILDRGKEVADGFSPRHSEGQDIAAGERKNRWRPAPAALQYGDPAVGARARQVALVGQFVGPGEQRQVGGAVIAEGADVTEAALRNFVSQRLADFKVPRKLLFLDEIPKGATGKLQRIGLAEKLGLG